MQHAIETVVDGFRFRSRLEARWHTFYEALGLEHRYEPEAFDLGVRGVYLPDFWLPQINCWVEIKLTEQEAQAATEKVRGLVEVTGGTAFLFFGDVWTSADAWRASLCEGICQFDIDYAGGFAPWGWAECCACGKIGLVRKPSQPACACQESLPPMQARTTRLLTAYTAARSARFDGWWRNRTGSDLQP